MKKEQILVSVKTIAKMDQLLTHNELYKSALRTTKLENKRLRAKNKELEQELYR